MNPLTRRACFALRKIKFTQSLYCSAGLAISLHLASGSLVHAQESPKLIGSASCATATCHGGVLDIGPAWHSSSSVWHARDKHAHAGEVLLNALSQRIVLALEPRATSEAVRNSVLAARCASCHAPAAALSTTQVRSAAAPDDSLRLIHEGVSCEACHGAASNWLVPHTRSDWPTLDRSLRYTLQSGMLDTESIATRTDNCVRCHVGSRTADGMVRDMNHDMIAAGHPRLTFDMQASHARLPAHWDVARDALRQLTVATSEPQPVSAVRDRVLLSAMRLSLERTERSSRSPGASEIDVDAPQPELAEYDCASCHRAFVANAQRPSRGLPRWQPWYTRGTTLHDLPGGTSADDLVWGKENLLRFLSGSAAALDQRSLQQLPLTQPVEPVQGAR